LDFIRVVLNEFFSVQLLILYFLKNGLANNKFTIYNLLTGYYLNIIQSIRQLVKVIDGKGGIKGTVTPVGAEG